MSLYTPIGNHLQWGEPWCREMEYCCGCKGERDIGDGVFCHCSNFLCRSCVSSLKWGRAMLLLSRCPHCIESAATDLLEFCDDPYGEVLMELLEARRKWAEAAK